MKLTKTKLRQLIKEELNKILENFPNPEFRERTQTDPLVYGILTGKWGDERDHKILYRYVKSYKQKMKVDPPDLDEFVKWVKTIDAAQGEWYESNLQKAQ
jgi:hypothetical protein